MPKIATLAVRSGIARTWQLVAAIEGINGIILLGWSTAFFVSIGNRFTRR